MIEASPFDPLAQARLDANPEVNRYHALVGKPGEIDPAAAEDLANYLEGRSTEATEVTDHYDETLAADDPRQLSMVALARRIGEAENANDATMADDLADVLVEKMDAYGDKVGLTDEGKSNLTNRLWKVMDIQEPELFVEEEEVAAPAETPNAAEPVEPELQAAAAPEAFPSAIESATIGKLVSAELERPEYGNDALISDNALGFYGVFDGVGAKVAAGEAARLAAKTMHEQYKAFADTPSASLFESMQRMGTALQIARRTISQRIEDKENAATTAVAVKIDALTLEDGSTKRYAIWGAAGDSRLFIRKANGYIQSLATEQNAEDRPNVVTNILYAAYDGSEDEIRAVEVEPGDRLMLCSDGITGDREEQRIEEMPVFAEAFGARTPKRAAKRFMEASLKQDDKSIIVVEIA